MINFSIYILTVAFTLFYFTDNFFLHLAIIGGTIGAISAVISEWIRHYNYLKKQ
jgi:hypothetical protein